MKPLLIAIVVAAAFLLSASSASAWCGYGGYGYTSYYAPSVAYTAAYAPAYAAPVYYTGYRPWWGGYRYYSYSPVYYYGW
jgi:hypothetical protein